MSIRKDILDEALGCVLHDRNAAYGDPSQDFKRTAALWTTLLGEQLNKPIEPWQVAQFMAALKLSRLTWSPNKRDSWVDLAGYAACGAECVLSPEPRPEGLSPSAKLRKLKEDLASGKDAFLNAIGRNSAGDDLASGIAANPRDWD